MKKISLMLPPVFLQNLKYSVLLRSVFGNLMGKRAHVKFYKRVGVVIRFAWIGSGNGRVLPCTPWLLMVIINRIN